MEKIIMNDKNYLVVYTKNYNQSNYSFISAETEYDAIDIFLNAIEDKNQLTKMLVTELKHVYKVPLDTYLFLSERKPL